MMLRQAWYIGIAGVVLVGCGHPVEKPHSQKAKEFANAPFNRVPPTPEEQERRARAFESKGLKPVTGKGKLLEVDQELGVGRMEVDGKPVRFWWKNRAYQSSVKYQTWNNPSATVNETPLQVELPFEAEVGDTVYFKGFMNHGELYVTAAGVRK